MNFKENYIKNVIPKVQKELKLSNRLAAPHLKKISVSVGIGSYLASSGGKDFSPVVDNISQITGQKPLTTKSRKAISNFKLKIGMPVGVASTLRGDKMYDFLNKLINVVLPRTRDFRGLPQKSFDGRGNYNIGIKEFTVFPEIKPDDIVKNHGIQITIVTSAKNNESAYALLKELGFPFKKQSTEKE